MSPVPCQDTLNTGLDLQKWQVGLDPYTCIPACFPSQSVIHTHGERRPREHQPTVLSGVSVTLLLTFSYYCSLLGSGKQTAKSMALWHAAYFKLKSGRALK